MMTQANTTTDYKGEIRPSTKRIEKLEDKIREEKDEQMGDESVSHKPKRDS